MKNYIIEYFGAYINNLENMEADCEQLCWESDDGFSHTVKEGKELLSFQLERDIKMLKEFKQDVEQLSFKKLSEKYNL